MTTKGATPEPKGIIAKREVDGFPVILKIVDESPPLDVRESLPWLTVITWRYDRAVRNGMPPEEENLRMITLEETIESSIQRPGVLRHAYSQTGNGKKELVYYIHDQQQFLEELNAALARHPRYPIEIDFYEDRAWEDFHTVLGKIAGR